MTLFPDVGGLSVPRAAQVYVEAGIPIAVFDPTRGNGKECGNLIGGGEGKWYEHVTADADVIRSWRAHFGRFTALATSPGGSIP